MKGSSPSASTYALEKLGSGRFDPLAVLGGLVRSGDGPVGFESAEVVEADDVVEDSVRGSCGRSTRRSRSA